MPTRCIISRTGLKGLAQMKKIGTTITGIFMISAATTFAYADDDAGFYLGVGYASTSIDIEGIDEGDESIPQLGLRGGYMFTNNFGIDFTGAVAGDTSSNGLSAEVGMLGISGIASVSLGKNFDLYGKLGGARVNTTVSYRDFSLSDETSTELFWGIGGEVDFGMVNLFLEYNRFDTDAININTPMAGIKLEF